MADRGTADHLSARIARRIRADGCGISLLGWPVEASDPVAGDLEDWQFVLGSGPSACTFQSGAATEHVTPSRVSPFPAFDEHLRTAKIASADSFPVTFGDRSVGAVTFYRASSEPLDRWHRHVAECSARDIADSIHDDAVGWAHRRPFVADNFHQAIGHVIEGQGLSADDAAVAIRAHAFASGTPLRVLCERILAGATTIQLG